jgi:hypothetical protein
MLLSKCCVLFTEFSEHAVCSVSCLEENWLRLLVLMVMGWRRLSAEASDGSTLAAGGRRPATGGGGGMSCRIEAG